MSYQDDYVDIPCSVYAFGIGYDFTIEVERSKKYTYRELDKILEQKVINSMSLSVDLGAAEELGVYE
jgi:hypothetical protein